MISVLRKSQPNIQEQIDSINYECYKAIVEVSRTANILVYYIGKQNFSQYITQSYQLDSASSLISSGLSSTVGITPSSILDPSWSSSFGNPYDSSAISQSTDFSFNNDFNCLAPSSLRTGNGIIKKIESKRIIADVNGS